MAAAGGWFGASAAIATVPELFKFAESAFSLNTFPQSLQKIAMSLLSWPQAVHVFMNLTFHSLIYRSVKSLQFNNRQNKKYGGISFRSTISACFVLLPTKYHNLFNK